MSRARDDDLTIESGGLIGAILSKSLAQSEVKDSGKIEFDRKRLPDANQRLFDDNLGTFLNGYDLSPLTPL
jgi:hypothetical protein